MAFIILKIFILGHNFPFTGSILVIPYRDRETERSWYWIVLPPATLRAASRNFTIERLISGPSLAGFPPLPQKRARRQRVGLHIEGEFIKKVGIKEIQKYKAAMRHGPRNSAAIAISVCLSSLSVLLAFFFFLRCILISAVACILSRPECYWPRCEAYLEGKRNIFDILFCL